MYPLEKWMDWTRRVDRNLGDSETSRSFKLEAHHDRVEVSITTVRVFRGERALRRAQRLLSEVSGVDLQPDAVPPPEPAPTP